MPKLITMGQGGAVITNNTKLARRLRLYKNFGRKKSGEDVHKYIGYNFKITDMQSMLGLEQLKTINWRIKKKNVWQNTIFFFLPFKHLKSRVLDRKPCWAY